ncbi:Aldo/keto reductase [Choiromyces venosus 120613-1]|uniref:Aldo/keto reductase n=1 Tax=Choiromyces venosus 120613-1 TaxID=1336337 RepID=A0A3N4JLX5_9PEZI|nr:Aldo/keto reductase [Choiromyces venosus 120613-1]
MGFGNKIWQPWCVGEVEALPVLKAAYDLGINTWDTANIYSNGECQRIVRKDVKEYKIPRDKLVIMMKCFCAVGEDPDMQTLLSPAILPEVNVSLERLGLGCIDLLQIYRVDPETPPEVTTEALHDLVKSGKVRYIGASSMCLYQQDAERNRTKFISMQNHYSVVYREEERDIIPYCRSTGVGRIPCSPLARGHLTRLPTLETDSVRKDIETKFANLPLFAMGTSEVDKKTISRIKEIADKKGWAMARLRLPGFWWIRRRSESLLGTAKAERAADMLGLKGKSLDESEVKYLEELYVSREISGHV